MKVVFIILMGLMGIITRHYLGWMGIWFGCSYYLIGILFIKHLLTKDKT